jgi:oligo-1,6-glucosidase
MERGGWSSCYLENHDQARSVPRWASQKPEFRAFGAKMLALFHIACTGTLYVSVIFGARLPSLTGKCSYQGQEIGMTNLPSSWGIEEYPDVATRIWWSE